MQTLYCGSCAAATQFEGIKPKFCTACGKPFDAAFAASTPAPRPTATPRPAAPTPSGRPTRPSLRAMKVQAEEINPPEVDEDDEEGYVDREEILARAERLTQGISANDFIVGTDDTGSRSFKFADLVKEAQAQKPTPAAFKPRKSRK